MKLVVKEIDSRYPCLKETEQELRVYFLSPREGIAVDVSKSKNWERGSYCGVWDEDGFTKTLWQPNPQPATEEITKYPCVGVLDTGAEVLFFEARIGRVILAGGEKKLNEASIGWNMSCFKLSTKYTVTWEDDDV